MPGAISRVFVSPGQAINADDVLVSTEAMKVETAIHAEENGTIAEVLVKAGD
ncbi:UNVERIFIED_ORG: pyruvate carboxylase [Rhizobium aethiopicum]|nr:biotinyl/lipoyl attachment domain-containing protein [Rhizobium sp. N324]ANM20133.1 biotinyl/lipoyl attachment domain-containing protein [Rhizobium sp. N541]ANM26518.1 biotinyl/lipoyl attachment domain-containing protein [Rhizobium sp. N941]OYD00785.1 biotinyl/lipoyl attachment domain-containing protein [Rhizobium sp. N4311]